MVQFPTNHACGRKEDFLGGGGRPLTFRVHSSAVSPPHATSFGYILSLCVCVWVCTKKLRRPWDHKGLDTHALLPVELAPILFPPPPPLLHPHSPCARTPLDHSEGVCFHTCAKRGWLRSVGGRNLVPEDSHDRTRREQRGVSGGGSELPGIVFLIFLLQYLYNVIVQL